MRAVERAAGDRLQDRSAVEVWVGHAAMVICCLSTSSPVSVLYLRPSISTALAWKVAPANTTSRSMLVKCMVALVARVMVKQSAMVIGASLNRAAAR